MLHIMRIWQHIVTEIIFKTITIIERTNKTLKSVKNKQSSDERKETKNNGCLYFLSKRGCRNN